MWFDYMNYMSLHPLQEKSVLASTFVDAKDKKLLRKTLLCQPKWLMHSDVINRVA